MNVNDITITSLETIDAFDIVTGSYLFTLDELQSATISQSEEKTDITGKQGRKLSSLKKNKSITVSGNNGLVSGGLLEVQTGSTFENMNTEVMWVDYLIAESDGGSGTKATMTYKAAGGKIEAVYKKNTDGTLGDQLALTTESNIGNTEFKYVATTGSGTSDTLKFSTSGVPAGTEVIVYYKRKINADVLNNMSDTYAKKCALYINAVGEDKCSNVYRIQFYIPKADFNGEFSIEMGENQTVHAFEAESLAGAGCGYHNQSGQLFTYTVFGADATDVA